MGNQIKIFCEKYCLSNCPFQQKKHTELYISNDKKILIQNNNHYKKCKYEGYVCSHKQFPKDTNATPKEIKIDDIHEITQQTARSTPIKSKVKDFLIINKVFFEIFSMILIPIIGICLTIATLNVYQNQLKLSEQQTAILINQNEPEFIFVEVTGSDSDENYNSYLFENIGGRSVKELQIHMMDELFISPNLSEGIILLEDMNKPEFINVIINGRYRESKLEMVDGRQLLTIKEDLNSSDLSSLQNNLCIGNEEELRDITIGFILGKRVIISYNNYIGEKQKRTYMLMPEMNIFSEDDSDGYNAYNFMRKNEIHYDFRFNDESDIVSHVINKLVDFVTQLHRTEIE